MRRDTSTGFGGLFIAAIILQLGVFFTIVGVAIHFISKFW